MTNHISRCISSLVFTAQTAAEFKQQARVGSVQPFWKLDQFIKGKSGLPCVGSTKQNDLKMSLVGKLCILVKSSNSNRNTCFLDSLNRFTLKCLVLTVKSLEILVLVVMIFSRSLVNHVYTCVFVFFRKGRDRTWRLAGVCVTKFYTNEMKFVVQNLANTWNLLTYSFFWTWL